MKFLWPAAWSLLALAIPVILFYLIRQKLRPKVVTTLLFWESLAPKVHNLPLWRRLRRVVSLLLQLLFLTLVVLAITRPTPPGQEQAASSTVIVLDPGVTTTTKFGTQTRWDAALDLARQRIDAMTFGDEATLILATDPPQVLSAWTRRRADLRQALLSAKVGATVTDIRPTLQLAQNLALGHNAPVIDLISDSVWPVAPPADEMTHVRLDRVGDAIPNSGITLFSARDLSSGAGEYQLALQIQQNTTAPVQGELEIDRNGQLMDELEVSVPPGAPWLKLWRGQATEACDFTAKWKPAKEEKFTGDESAETTLPPVRPVNVSLISPAFPFLEAAFGSQTQIELHKIWPAPTTPIAESGLHIFYHAVPAGDAMPSDAVLIDPASSGPWGQRQGPMAKPLVSDEDKDAPLMRFADLMPVQLRSATVFQPPAGAHIYAASFGQPLVYGHWESEPRWLVIAFDPDESDFVLRTAFPILCANLIQPLHLQQADSSRNVPGPVATQLKALASGSGGQEIVPQTTHFGWARAIPLWWWVAIDALILLLLEWSWYTRRITE